MLFQPYRDIEIQWIGFMEETLLHRHRLKQLLYWAQPELRNVRKYRRLSFVENVRLNKPPFILLYKINVSLLLLCGVSWKIELLISLNRNFSSATRNNSLVLLNLIYPLLSFFATNVLNFVGSENHVLYSIYFVNNSFV